MFIERNEKMINKFSTNANLAIISGMALIKLNELPTNAINHRDDFLDLLSKAIEREGFSQLKEFKKWVSLNIASLGEERLFSIINEANLLSKELLMKEFNQAYPYSKLGSTSFSGNNDLDNLAISLIGISKTDTFLDPTAGINGAWLNILEQNHEQRITLQTLLPLEACFAYLNARINNGKNVQIYAGNVLTNPQYVNENNLEQFDRVVTTPPLGTRFATELINNLYNRFKYGKIISTNATWGFVSNVLASLKSENGKAAVFVGNGDLSGSASRKIVRNNILNSDLIEAVISFPGGFVNNSPISINLLILNLNKKKLKSKVLFIDANQDKWLQKGKKGKTTLHLTTEGVTRIKELINHPTSIVNVSKIEEIKNCQETLIPRSHIVKDHLSINNVEYRVDNSELERLNTIPLEKIASIQRGFNMAHKNKAVRSNYKILKVSDLGDNEQINYSQLSNVTVEPNTHVDDYQIHKDDIVVSVRGSLGKAVYISEEPKEKILISSNLVIIRAHNVEPEWLCIYLKSTLAKYFIKKFSSGTTVKILPISELKKLPITNVSKEEQMHTIEANNESIKEIKKMRQELINKQNNLARKIDVLVGNNKVVFPIKSNIRN